MHKKPSQNTLKCTENGTRGSPLDLFMGKLKKPEKLKKATGAFAPAA
jgi:hypothetical protein